MATTRCFGSGCVEVDEAGPGRARRSRRTASTAPRSATPGTPRSPARGHRSRDRHEDRPQLVEHLVAAVGCAAISGFSGSARPRRALSTSTSSRLRSSSLPLSTSTPGHLAAGKTVAQEVLDGVLLSERQLECPGAVDKIRVLVRSSCERDRGWQSCLRNRAGDDSCHSIDGATGSTDRVPGPVDLLHARARSGSDRHVVADAQAAT